MHRIGEALTRSSRNLHWPKNTFPIMRFLGIDLGTASLKLAILDEDGQERAASGAAHINCRAADMGCIAQLRRRKPV